MIKVRNRRAVAAAAIVAVAAVVAIAVSVSRSSDQFGWLHPAPGPAGWPVARTPGGASFAYPPDWRPFKTDPGTASAALLTRSDGIAGYLNATPKAGAETLSSWTRFRPGHNGEEGDRGVRVLAVAEGLAFRSGRGSCVIDSYRTTRNEYREIACLVAGPRSAAVIVAAAPNASWNSRAATLERAVSSFVP